LWCFSFCSAFGVDVILLVWLITLNLRLEKVRESFKKGMLLLVFVVIYGKDGFVVEVDGILFGCVMLFVGRTWISFRV
jgi:hypothetical protein